MLTTRPMLTRDQIIEDALSHGRSLAWQEKWVAGVQAGIEAADRGDFADEEEIAAVLNKYNQAQRSVRIVWARHYLIELASIGEYIGQHNPRCRACRQS